MSLEDMLEGVAFITRVETGRLESIYVCMGRSVLFGGTGRAGGRVGYSV